MVVQVLRKQEDAQQKYSKESEAVQQDQTLAKKKKVTCSVIYILTIYDCKKLN